MSKRILILKSSPRKNGNSNTLADQVAVGAKEKGAEVESFMLHDMDIRPCDACDTCQETGICVIKDDMQKIYPLLEKADAIVIASPIYWFTVNAQAKLCIDRWYALFDEDSEEKAYHEKQAGIILTYGDDDLHTSGGINAVRMYESTFEYLGAKIAGIVHGTADQVDDAKNNPDLMEQALQLGQKLGTGEKTISQ